MAQPVFNGREKEYLIRCVESGWLSSAGEFIEKFENQFASFCGASHGVSCINGTSALHLALLARDVGPGDEVVVPAMTYVATANAVTYCGATPVLAECERDTWNLDPARLEEKISPRTKGILVVHLFGLPVDMDPILAIARKHGLFVIEDASQAHGATYRGRRIGSIGDLATFSFFANKIMTCGEGGMIVTNNERDASRMRQLRNQGMSPKRRYWFEAVGYNYRMTNMQAAVGLAQLEQVEWHLLRHREVANWYFKHLRGMETRVTLPVMRDWATHVFWMFTILVNESAPIARDELISRLREDGIETRPIFYPLNEMPPYRKLPGQFPISVEIGARGISLPTHAALKEDDVTFVAERLRHHCS